jgi:hypothetical protein
MTNLERMIALADEFFDVKNDPDQIAVDERVRRQLLAIHPATMGEVTDSDGPIAWMLVIPTTNQLMRKFLRKEISERELLDETPVSSRYDAVYLCSALVLPEHRRKNLANEMAIKAIRAIMSDHPIKDLFYWAFSPEGTRLAGVVAGELHLRLHQREP